MSDPVKIATMIIMVMMSLVTLAVCVYSVKNEQNQPSGIWMMLAVASGLGTIALLKNVCKLAGIEFGD